MKNGLVVNKSGTQEWYKNGLLHREDGPAVVYLIGIREWYQNGRLHRVDGPACEGSKCWYYKGIFVGHGDKPDPELWARLTSVELNGGPLLNGYIVDLHGNTRWYKDDVLHREDGPAFEVADGSKDWFLQGENLGYGAKGFWKLWDLLIPEQRANPNLLKHLPR